MKAKLRDAEIFFDIDGSGWVPDKDRMVERPVVFLLHGGPGGDHASFRTPAIEKLREVAQLIYVDHRGSGRSSAVDMNTCTLDNNIDDVDALREYLGLERITVFGSSYGGMVAQGYATRYPQHLANLVLASTAPSYRFMDDAQAILQERGTPDQIRVCERLWAGNFESEKQLKEYYTTMGPMYSTTFDPDKAEVGWSRSIRNYQQLNLGFGDFLRTFDFTDQLSTIACPTLVLGGAHDWICPVNHSRTMAELIPRAHLKIFENSAHAIPQDEPDAFHAAVRGFLTYAAP